MTTTGASQRVKWTICRFPAADVVSEIGSRLLPELTVSDAWTLAPLAAIEVQCSTLIPAPPGPDDTSTRSVGPGKMLDASAEREFSAERFFAAAEPDGACNQRPRAEFAVDAGRPIRRRSPVRLPLTYAAPWTIRISASSNRRGALRYWCRGRCRDTIRSARLGAVVIAGDRHPDGVTAPIAWRTDAISAPAAGLVLGLDAVLPAATGSPQPWSTPSSSVRASDGPRISVEA